MKPTTQSIFDIFQQERRYLVPLFQRQYVWDRANQWEPLWNDLERQAVNAGRALHRGESMETTHFLGAVVLNARVIVGLGIPISEIIDGQQRLTTLQIFLAALRDYAKDVEEEKADELKRLTRNPKKKNDPDGRFKVWPTNSDRGDFTAVMEAGGRDAVIDAFPEAANEEKLPRMAQAYLYFYDRVHAFAEQDELPAPLAEEDANGRLDALVHALKTALLSVVIELEQSDDPQVIFETLNARGQPLLPSDLIRNYLFLKASNEGLDADNLYSTYWSSFDNRPEPDPQNAGNDRFWHVDERQGRLKRPRIDLFIFHYITMNAERETVIGQLFREFRSWYSESASGVEPVLQDLAEKREHFGKLLIPDESTRLLAFAKRLKSLDTSTPFPVLLYLLSVQGKALDTKTVERIATDLDSYMVRRFVCGLTPKNYNRFFVGLLRTLRQTVDAGGDAHQAVRQALLEPTGPAGAWPDDKTFLRAWLNERVYRKSRPDRAVMLLRAIEDRLRRDNAKSEAHIPPDGLTIEHLMPQAAAPDVYPLPGEREAPLRDEESLEDRRERLLHSIGNLTLLTGNLNASASNDPFSRKGAEIAEHSDLRLNARFRQAVSASWTEPQIIERARELFEPALRVWPHPSGQPGGTQYVAQLNQNPPHAEELLDAFDPGTSDGQPD